MTFEEWPAQSGVTASEMAARFKSSSRRGSGRAALLLEADPTNEELQSMLLSACKTNLTYDPQCEEERAPYLYRLITLTRRSDFFWTELSRCLDNFDQSSNGEHSSNIRRPLPPCERSDRPRPSFLARISRARSHSKGGIRTCRTSMRRAPHSARRTGRLSRADPSLSR